MSARTCGLPPQTGVTGSGVNLLLRLHLFRLRKETKQTPLLPLQDFFGKSDPFLEFYRQTGTGWQLAHRTEVWTISLGVQSVDE